MVEYREVIVLPLLNHQARKNIKLKKLNYKKQKQKHRYPEQPKKLGIAPTLS